MMESNYNLQKTLGKIYESAFEAMAGLIDTRNMYIALFDEQVGMINFDLIIKDGQPKMPGEEPFIPRPLGERNGLTEWVIRNKQPLLIKRDFDEWARGRDDVEVFEGLTKCWLGAPMIYRDNVIGVIGLQNFERENVFDEQHKALLETIASQAAVAIEAARQQQKLNKEQKQRLEEQEQKIKERDLRIKLELERLEAEERENEKRLQLEFEKERARQQQKLAEERRQRLVRLQEISERMAEASVSPDEVLGVVVSAARELSHSNMASIYLFDPPAEKFSRGVRSLPDDSIIEVELAELPSKTGLPAQMVHSQVARFVEDVAQHPDATDFAKNREIQAFAGLPLSVGRIEGARPVVGVLFVNFTSPHQFSNEQKEILQHLANQAAIAIDYAGVRQSAQASEQLGALGTAAATLQHRLGNTINVILPAVMRLRLRLGNDEENEEILQTIERNALFATEVIRRMQTPLREEAFVETDFNTLLLDAIKKSAIERERYPKALITTDLPDLEPVQPVSGEPIVHIQIDADLADNLPLSSGKTGQLTEVFRVLVENAIKAVYVEEADSLNEGLVSVKSKLTGNRLRPSVEILVSDNGKGIDDSIRERLFKQPVPRKEFGQGAGLGLWLSNIIINSHEGSIKLESTEVGAGSTFKVTLPVLERRHNTSSSESAGGEERDKASA